MGRKLIRHVSVGTVVLALAAAAGVSAFAASSNRGHQFGQRGGPMMMRGFGFGFGGPGFGGPRGGGGLVYADVLTPAAGYLSIPLSTLQSDLKGGKTLAQEAAAKGKTVDGLVQAMLAPLRTELDKRVTAGDITAAQETTIVNHATTMLTNLVNNTKPDKMQAGLRIAGARLALQKIFLFHR